MKKLNTNTVVSYKYKDEKEANLHEQLMKNDGWRVSSNRHPFIKNYREYSRRQREGAFL